MINRYFVAILVLLTTIAYTDTLFAQEEQTEETFAHSTRRHWKGIDVTTVLNNPDFATNGKKIYLYNVGTGRFIIEGGNWGMEGRLFHEDFGRPMYLMSSGYIKSGITEQNVGSKIMFGNNVPRVSRPDVGWDSYKKRSFTPMMDADENHLSEWTFKRVETDPESDTYTYYMWEAMPKNKPKNYYLGAAWGEWHVPEYKGDGLFIYLDDDRATWTTGDVIGNMEKKQVGEDLITIDELYQWRIISEEEFISVLNDEVVGFNPSISILVPDRDFTRNADNFDSNWVMETKDGSDYTTTGRLGYTLDTYLDKKKQDTYYKNEAWNKPVRLKEVFDSSMGYNEENGMAYSKYSFLTFEGVGRTYTEFDVPNPGWYQVQCYGFVQSDQDHDAYLFAKVKGSTETTSYGGESKENLVKVPAGTFKDKNKNYGCLAVGKDLTEKGEEKYKCTIWICVTEEQFNSGMRTVQVGVGKDEATQSKGVKNGNVTYYYDTDWVCVDDYRVSFMGTGPVFFYEDEESLDYLGFDPDNIKRYQSSTPNGQYSGAACLERTMKTGQWNSFSFPLPLTGEQMRLAFGEDACLAVIHSVGNMSQNPEVIDFKTVSLHTTEYIVQPGQFYLLKPTKEPTKGVDPRGKETTFYELGRMFFSVNETEPATYKHPRMSLNTWKVKEEEITSRDGNHDGWASVNYVQTPEYNTFKVSSDGIYTGEDTDKEIYAAKGAYVVSNNTIVHLKKTRASRDSAAG